MTLPLQAPQEWPAGPVRLRWSAALRPLIGKPVPTCALQALQRRSLRLASAEREKEMCPWARSPCRGAAGAGGAPLLMRLKRDGFVPIHALHYKDRPDGAWPDSLGDPDTRTGTARTGAYFSTALFIGAATAILMLGDTTSLLFWLASGLMAAGVWLHLTERHEHEHTHELIEHRHRHVHDQHHQHEHNFEWNGTEPHTHPHRHVAVTHKHAHYPDIHHRHAHS